MRGRKWTKEKIIEELKVLRKDRPAHDARLYAAAKKHFGQYSTALKTAGLQFCERPPAISWTKSSVIEALQRRHREGKRIEATHTEDTRLYGASKRMFGTWKAACAAAGLPIRTFEYYTPDEVRLRIIELYEQELPLTFPSHNDDKLRRSARRYFGTWRNAVESLGLGSEVRRKWTSQAVIDGIQHRHASGKNLFATHREDKGLFTAAVRRFGNWQNAMKAAGIHLRPRERWSKARVIERIQEIAETAQGQPLKITDNNLAYAAYRFFGSLVTALEAADAISLTKRWTKNRIIKEIQSKFDEGAPRNLFGFGDLHLALASKHHFGSWAAAVEAAGLADRVHVKQFRQRLTKDEVREIIQEGCAAGKPLSEIRKMNMGLESAARRHYGKWKNAVEAAGFELTRRCWSRDLILSEIKQRLKENKSVACNDPNNINLAAAAARHFGSWTAALTAARVDTKRRKPR